MMVGVGGGVVVVMVMMMNHLKMVEMRRLVRWRTRESMLALSGAKPAGIETEGCRTLA